jgi:hypothetical protein
MTALSLFWTRDSSCPGRLDRSPPPAVLISVHISVHMSPGPRPFTPSLSDAAKMEKQAGKITIVKEGGAWKLGGEDWH